LGFFLNSTFSPERLAVSIAGAQRGWRQATGQHGTSGPSDEVQRAGLLVRPQPSREAALTPGRNQLSPILLRTKGAGNPSMGDVAFIPAHSRVEAPDTSSYLISCPFPPPVYSPPQNTQVSHSGLLAWVK